VGAFNVAWPGLVSGLFIDYWLQFCCGIVLYLRLCRVERRQVARRIDLGMSLALLVIVGVAWRRGELHFHWWVYQFYGQLAVCLAFTLALMVLRRWDEPLSRSPLGGLLGPIGAISYSLYLIHRPLLTALEPADLRLQPRWGGVWDVCVIAIVLAVSWLFHRLFERPFLNRPA
jgi:peptidoglycan/LPS O-acetylase OafA/YrhL